MYLEENIDIFLDENIDVYMEKYYDLFFERYTEMFLEDLADSLLEKSVINKECIISNEKSAKQYALLIYDEDMTDWERELDIWVKYYEKYGLWVANLKYPPTMIDGLSFIIFQAKDGKVVYYE
ncbi:MAG: hypothetical protein FWG61_05120 [Firmicutes bacterium]|nr:hypothetical protein [Bacillota bacterium]